MNPRTLLVLTIVVALLGGYIFFFEKNTLSTDERAAQEKKVLVLEDDDVRALEISWADSKVRLERLDPEVSEEEKQDVAEKGDIFAKPEPEWRLTEPMASRADAAAVRSLLTTLTTLEKVRTLEDVSRSDAGFDEPRGRVTLVASDDENVSKETVLEIGPELPASSDMLVALGEAIHQVPASLWTDLTKRPGDWRDKNLFTAGRQRIDRISLSSTGQDGATQVLLGKRGDDFWIESPLTDLADDGLANGLMTAITDLKVESFLDDAGSMTADLGLEPPAYVLEVVLAGQDDAFRVEIGNVVDAAAPEEPQTAIVRVGGQNGGGQIVEIKTRLLDALTRTPEGWRSRAWTPLQVYRVESARFSGAPGSGDPVEVTRVENDWLRGDDRIAYSAVSDVLYALSEAKAEEVLSREEAVRRGHSLAESMFSATLETEDSDESLALYARVDGLSAATRDGRDAVLLLGAEAVDEVMSKLEELRSAEPLPDEEEKTDDQDNS